MDRQTAYKEANERAKDGSWKWSQILYNKEGDPIGTEFANGNITKGTIFTQ